MLSRLMLAFLVRGTGERFETTCFKGIGGSWDTWHAQGDLGNGEALESNTAVSITDLKTVRRPLITTVRVVGNDCGIRLAGSAC